MRADEHGWDPKGPPTLLDYRAATDDAGKRRRVGSGIILPAGRRRSRRAADWRPRLRSCRDRRCRSPGQHYCQLGDPVRIRQQSRPRIGSDDAVAGRPGYARRAGCRTPSATRASSTRSPRRPAWIRSKFRLKYLDSSDTRGIELLERLRKFAKWQTRPSPQKSASGNVRTGRGMSYVKYELVRTYVGVVADDERRSHDRQDQGAIASGSSTTAARSSTPTACATRSKET